ncbi:CsbD family protein [Neisseriaceae bacterium ESL0693]|nr:CsbD family protein [Neisseriaceae bacterium ESL0693]
MTDNGTVDKVTGNVKNEVGKITGDTKTQAEGVLDKAVGGAKTIAHETSDAIKDAVDTVKNKLKD